MRSIPAHKQTDPAKQAGQIINRPEPPSNHDMMDDMAEYVSAKEHKPVHGGRPGEIERKVQKMQAFGFRYGTSNRLAGSRPEPVVIDELRIVGSQEGGRK